MVEEILLHVGMHKTGTTALQQALAGYDDGRIRHARLGWENHSIPFVTCFSSDPFHYHVWQRSGATREQVAQERDRMRASLGAELSLPRDRLLVVGEEISLLPPAAIQSMATALRGRQRQVAILAYLRDPAGYVTSAFQQQVRGGQSCYTLPRPHYRQRFAKFLNTFGPEAVTFRAYRPEAFPDRSVIADFAGIAGLRTAALPQCTANPALPLDALRLVHLLNRTVPAARSRIELTARSTLIAALSQHFSNRFALPPEITASVIDRDEVAWMENVSLIALGPQAAQTDPDRAQTALARLLDTIPAATVDRLRAELASRNLPHSRNDTAADLLRIFHDSLLATGPSGLAGARAMA